MSGNQFGRPVGPSPGATRRAPWARGARGPLGAPALRAGRGRTPAPPAAGTGAVVQLQKMAWGSALEKEAIEKGLELFHSSSPGCGWSTSTSRTPTTTSCRRCWPRAPRRTCLRSPVTSTRTTSWPAPCRTSPTASSGTRSWGGRLLHPALRAGALHLQGQVVRHRLDGPGARPVLQHGGAQAGRGAPARRSIRRRPGGGASSSNLPARVTVRPGTWPTAWGHWPTAEYGPAVVSNGGKILDPQTLRFALDRPEAVEAVQRVADLTLKDRVAPRRRSSRVAPTSSAWPAGSTPCGSAELAAAGPGPLGFAYGAGVLPKLQATGDDDDLLRHLGGEGHQEAGRPPGSSSASSTRTTTSSPWCKRASGTPAIPPCSAPPGSSAGSTPRCTRMATSAW